MRYGKAHKEETRRRILEKAAARFRRDGIAAVGLRTLVGDAGLTHGAFYAHFPSRADIVAASIAAALADTRTLLEQAVESVAAEDRFAAIVAGYLSQTHRNAAAHGCAGAALAPEVAREDLPSRRAFGDGIAHIVALIAESLPQGGGEKRASRARSIFAGMMGAMQLARIAEDGEAETILQEARDAAHAAARRPW